jgi:hypothetical protein
MAHIVIIPNNITKNNIKYMLQSATYNNYKKSKAKQDK